MEWGWIHSQHYLALTKSSNPRWPSGSCLHPSSWPLFNVLAKVADIRNTMPSSCFVCRYVIEISWVAVGSCYTYTSTSKQGAGIHFPSKSPFPSSTKHLLKILVPKREKFPPLQLKGGGSHTALPSPLPPQCLGDSFTSIINSMGWGPGEGWIERRAHYIIPLWCAQPWITDLPLIAS